jgi:hypothetical protein
MVIVLSVLKSLNKFDVLMNSARKGINIIIIIINYYGTVTKEE